MTFSLTFSREKWLTGYLTGDIASNVTLLSLPSCPLLRNTSSPKVISAAICSEPGLELLTQNS